MNRIVLSVVIALLGLGFSATDVEARRLGGGLSQGMKRTPPRQQTPDTPPPQQATPQQPAATPGMAGATAAAAAAPARRSWLGPVAGLAAGLGIAALASHLGFGEGLANFMTLLLVALVAVWGVRLLLRRFAPPAQRRQGLQYAGAHGADINTMGDAGMARTAWPAGGTPSQASGHRPALPPGFDAAEFERAAKMIFIRMQAANDTGDLDDLRQFSTPEMFAAFRVDLQDRGSAQQRTDVVKLDAEMIDWAVEDGKQIVSVRFHGLVREEENGVAAPFDEVWHLVQPADGSRQWAIAGIQQQPQQLAAH